jgi:hypothetical protein
MKWLFRIAVYLFPRKRWQTIETYADYSFGRDGRPGGHVYVQKDQFGNMRKFKVGGCI